MYRYVIDSLSLGALSNEIDQNVQEGQVDLTDLGKCIDVSQNRSILGEVLIDYDMDVIQLIYSENILPKSLNSPQKMHFFQKYNAFLPISPCLAISGQNLGMEIIR